MSYASLMVEVGVDDISDARVTLAAGLAERFGARLIGVSAAAISSGFIEDEGKRIGETFTIAEERFRAMAGARAIRLDWRCEMDMPTDVLTREARAADLIIVGREGFGRNADHYRLADPGDLLMKAGRPILVAPAGVDDLGGRRIVIGWQDMREARRAVLDALPLLVRAERVFVTTVDEDESEDLLRSSIADAVAYLQGHDVPSEGVLRPFLEASVADELIRFAEREGADLIVAGGYGHSRFREWIFGGTTQRLLGRSPLCCLLAH